jgi:hypothetical protein
MPSPPARSRGFAGFAAFPIAALLAVISAVGLLHPALYARESPAWLGQAVGQDWFDLLVATPWLAICGLGARTSSRTWRVLLAGSYGYVAYELMIYAFAVHFNALFLVYCATLGLSAYALIALIGELATDIAPIPRGAARLGGGFLIGLGAAFAVLWLAEDLPAILGGIPPASLTETGLYTNPVHVIDLAFVLPAHVITGVLLWRQRRSGELLAPVVLAFGVPMALSIAVMMVVLRLRGELAPVPVIAAMFVVAALTAGVLARVLACVLGAAREQSVTGRAPT